MAPYKNGKLIFLDIDGTICYPGDIPSEKTVAAIARARQNGHKVFIATGRNESTIQPEVLRIGFDGMICSAGALVKVGDQLLLDRKLDEDQIRMGIDTLKRFGLHPILEGARYSYSDIEAHKGLLLQDIDPTNTETQRVAHQLLYGGRYRNMSLYQGEAVYKITYLSRNRQNLLLACVALQDDFDCVVYEGMNARFGLISGEMTAKGIDKGEAIKMICRQFRTSSSDAIAFGDSRNDLSMLKVAGIGIAMGNAPGSVQQAADRVCEPCQQDGIYHEFCRLGII